MKAKFTLLVSALAAFTTLATEDAEVVEMPESKAVGRGNCDLMASNTVRAVFRGFRQVTSQAPLEAQPTASDYAIFEVVQSLAHKQHVCYGDTRLKEGMLFSVSLDRNMLGQPTSVVDEILLMQLGEECVMKIDHLFVFDEPQGLNIRPCTRLARKPGSAAPAIPAYTPQTVPVTPEIPAAPEAPVAPGTGNGSGILYGTAQ
jgi:hypothetical protein